MKSSTPSPNSYHNKPISQLTHQDWKYAFQNFMGELAVHAVLYGVGALLCTTIGAMIWISVWFGVLLVPFGVMGYYLFKKYQNQTHQNS